MKLSLRALPTAGTLTYSGVPEGYDSYLLGYLAKQHGDLLFITTDEAKMVRTAQAVSFFYPELEIIQFPAWDCLPYDRVSPHTEIVSQRVDALTSLVVRGKKSRLILTTVSAFLQKVPPKESFEGAVYSAKAGDEVRREDLISFLEQNGYQRSETVMEPGEYAVRGDIVDVFPPGHDDPLRLDLEWDEVSGIRSFDPVSQRTIDQVKTFALKPVSELPMGEEAISRFRTQFRKIFGAKASKDPLYEAVSEGRRPIGVEHWLPLFHEKMDCLLDYLPKASKVVFDTQVDHARASRLEMIEDYYEARADVADAALTGEAPYNPIETGLLYLNAEDWNQAFDGLGIGQLNSFDEPESDTVIDGKGRRCLDFAEARANPNANVYDAVRQYIVAEQNNAQRVIVAAYSDGSRDRLMNVLKEHNVAGLAAVGSFKEVELLPKDAVALVVLGLEHGFAFEGLTVLSEQDILGDRMVRPARRRMRAENFIAEASSLNETDLVVHVDHGIGRYEGLETIDVGGAPHDCLILVYDGGDKLFLPVENIELLSRFGSDQGAANLDKLGGVAWQARKARLKERVRDIADELIKVAAARELRKGDAIAPPDGLYEEFCTQFKFVETDDQLRAIGDAISDLKSGRPMDRLVCGDVGFGKTEVALRAAFVAAMSGMQVAVVVPTTLLARQHYNNFTDRFKDFPIRIQQLSRLVTTTEAKRVKEEMDEGTVDIVVGTHALLAKNVKFKRLGLLIVDEEQHFGVTHKEQLKKLKSDVHVLTLTATPIPRTLQMALTGVKEMSLIATPPVDRLAVRTFVMPFDHVVVREAIQRERFRGGQCFYVCPRLADLDKVAAELHELVPDAKIAVAHGRMKPKELEEVMTAFSEKAFDILLATNIVESGLDLPSVNTIFIHRADMFGLAQLYQLRGRVGRSKTRAYAYLTLPPGQKISKTAQKRLEVMQTLDSLGAGFTLASHDLDIRGAGNLLGDEQSGHIKEVGIELYQQMLEEAVAEAKGGGDQSVEEHEWSPQIGIGLPVLIPESYIADLNVRMELYRRVSTLKSSEELDGFAAEMVDRFGPMPGEVENLLDTVTMKRMCREASIEKIDAGPKGAVIKFRNNEFSNPDGLVRFLMDQAGTAKMRPDHCLVFMRRWDDMSKRVGGVKQLLVTLGEMARAS
ncbi:Transcription-repair-coupling factor [Candidatus Terasakiella magnetica]|uniref:Transcription-repair-coupling factor n=1 Tax=Candidatus Terasakiella magnetica TaxID=1867952 RepID=A0A1C3RC54_9PROT|nr:transcription-repair coupling factor [Candidatus Terasakiella magnetica]SCA54814.1 Transcription-repair-coupling factor [Candidatus Terasakiella magnetica]